MRKAVLGSIAALTAGAGVANAQGFPNSPAAGVTPANGYGQVIPPNFGGGDPGIIPNEAPAPNGAPSYPPPGQYGAPPGGDAGGFGAPSRLVAPHYWFNSEYLLWFARAQPTSTPYVTTSARSDAGILGRPSTSILFGKSDLGYGTFSGFRLSGGWWRGEDRRIGFEFGGMLTEKKGNYYFAQSDNNGVPVISRPFTDATSGNQGFLAVSFPNFASGSILALTTTQTFGADGNMLVNLFRSCPDEGMPISISGLAGFRYLDIQERLNITSASTLLGQNTTTFTGLTVNAPATIGVSDDFNATNRFYGGQLGLKGEVRYNKLTIGFTGKVAAGLMNQTLDLTGHSTVNDPTRGIAAVAPGGLFVSPQANGRYRNDEFAVIPEGVVQVGYNWSSWLTSYVGYTFLYANRVVRPGNQLSSTINPGVTPTSPTFGGGGFVNTPNNVLRQDEFWLQGVSFGILAKY